MTSFCVNQRTKCAIFGTKRGFILYCWYLFLARPIQIRPVSTVWTGPYTIEFCGLDGRGCKYPSHVGKHVVQLKTSSVVP